MPPHRTQLGGLRTAFSIIELDFKAPFTRDGPPEYLQDVLVECFHNLEGEEWVDWILWGHDLGAPNKVCIMVAWERHLLFTVRNFKLPILEQMEVAQRATAILKGKDILNFVDILCPFLVSTPTILDTINNGSHDDFHPPYNYRSNLLRGNCDTILVETLASGSLYETVNAGLEELKQDCFSITRRYGQEKRGDLNHVTFGVDRSVDEEPSTLVPGTCTFIFLMYWSGSEEMERFKDPAGKTFGVRSKELEADWWSVKVLKRLAGFREEGAVVRAGTYDFRYRPKGWPSIVDFPEYSLSKFIKAKKRKSCGLCSVM